jgi:hypothetical protein
MTRLIALTALLALGACTTTQRDRVETVAATVCTSLPLAQALYNLAIQSGDRTRANLLLTSLQLSCPAMLALIQTYQPPAVVVPAPPPPVSTPERG